MVMGQTETSLTITESRPGEVLAALHESADPEREYLFAAREAGPDDLILVAWSGSEALGYLAASEETDGGLLVWEHVVVPARRGQGIGQRLLIEAARRTRPNAIIVIDPMAELDQDRIADYYRGLGFNRPDGEGLWAAAADLVLAIRHRQGAAEETATPISAIVDGKPPGVFTISPDAPVREAVSAMSDHQVGALVVSTDGSRVEGILAERDVVVALDRLGQSLLDSPVGGVCTADVFTVTVTDSVADVMDLMTNRKIRHLPITSAGRLSGIVSLGDLVNHRLIAIDNEAGRLT